MQPIDALKRKFRGGHHAQAIAECEALCRAHPTAIELKPLCATMHSVVGDPPRSLALLRDVHAATPADPDVLFNLAMCERESGDFAAAEAGLRRYVSAHPRDPSGWASLAEAQLQLKAFEAGVASADRAIGLEPESARLRVVRGDALQRAGKLQEAIADYTYALKLAPGDDEALKKASTGLLQAGQGERALALCREIERVGLRGRRVFEARRPLDARGAHAVPSDAARRPGAAGTRRMLVPDIEGTDAEETGVTGTTIHGAWNDDPDAVTLIDAHHHIWDLRTHRYPWLQADPPHPFFLGDYSPLRRDYFPDDYKADARGHNVLATVHVEAEMDRDRQVDETRWLTEMNRRHGMPNAIVAHAWFHEGDTDAILAAHAAFPLVRGIRSKPVTSASPDSSVAGQPGTMQDPAWLRGFALLEKHGLSWDLRVPSWHLAEAADVARSFPRVPIVLNHTGFPWDRSEAGLAAWRRQMEAIARCPNVHLKVSEFGLKDAPWDYDSNARVVADAIAIFGIERCMFASNFPVAGLRIGYDALVRAVKRMVSGFPAADQERFFWRNAQAFYRI